MLQKRELHSACAFKNSIIVSGGEYSPKTCEMYNYDKGTDDWTELPDLNEGRKDHSSCSFENKNVYVFAGFNGSGLND